MIFGETLVVKNLYLKRNSIIHMDIKYSKKHKYITISNTCASMSYNIPDSFSCQENGEVFTSFQDFHFTEKVTLDSFSQEHSLL